MIRKNSNDYLVTCIPNAKTKQDLILPAYLKYNIERRVLKAAFKKISCHD
jgi:hypothetical protein